MLFLYKTHLSSTICVSTTWSPKPDTHEHALAKPTPPKIVQIDENIPTPFKITTSKGLKKINNEWKSLNTGYTKSRFNNLEIKGNLDNLYAVGCFSQTGKDMVATINSALDASSYYLQKYENINTTSSKCSTLNLFCITIIIVLIFCFIKTNRKFTLLLT